MTRKSLIEKVKALLAKTVANGCSECEAMSALDKAEAMIAAYEVSDAELALTKTESAIIHADVARNPHGIRYGLALVVADFCDVKVWSERTGRTKSLRFCGMPSDVDFATWLLDSLTGFVQSELANHLIGHPTPKSERSRVINGFVGGCVIRITARMRNVINARRVAARGNSRALVVTKTGAIADAMLVAGIGTLGKSRPSRRHGNASDYYAGQVAGERASFGRPVNGRRAAGAAATIYN